MVTKMQTQRMGSVPILCINVNITIDTMSQFDTKADANINIDALCEMALISSIYFELTVRVYEFSRK